MGPQNGDLSLCVGVSHFFWVLGGIFSSSVLRGVIRTVLRPPRAMFFWTRVLLMTSHGLLALLAPSIKRPAIRRRVPPHGWEEYNSCQRTK